MTDLAPLAFRNGEFLPAAELSLSPTDAGFVFGATLTDYCRTVSGKLVRHDLHLARFRRDAERLGIPLAYSDDDLARAATVLVAQHLGLLPPGSNLALITFLTPGPLGYMVGARENGPPTLVLHTFPRSEARYRAMHEQGAILEIVGQLPAIDENLLPRTVKHRSRLPWWLAQKQVQHAGAIPALIDPVQGAIDTPIAALLAVAGGTVYRCPRGAVQDSVTVQILELACSQRGIPFEEAPLDPISGTVQDHPIEELLLAGSGFGVAPVQRIVQGTTERRFSISGPLLPILLEAEIRSEI